mgnify:CR=1 FL=1
MNHGWGFRLRVFSSRVKLRLIKTSESRNDDRGRPDWNSVSRLEIRLNVRTKRAHPPVKVNISFTISNSRWKFRRNVSTFQRLARVNQRPRLKKPPRAGAFQLLLNDITARVFSTDIIYYRLKIYFAAWKYSHVFECFIHLLWKKKKKKKARNARLLKRRSIEEITTTYPLFHSRKIHRQAADFLSASPRCISLRAGIPSATRRIPSDGIPRRTYVPAVEEIVRENVHERTGLAKNRRAKKDASLCRRDDKTPAATGRRERNRERERERWIESVEETLRKHETQNLYVFAKKEKSSPGVRNLRYWIIQDVIQIRTHFREHGAKSEMLEFLVFGSLNSLFW